MSEDAPREVLDVENPAPEDERLYSVTTLQKAASGIGPGLEYWMKEQVATCAVTSRKTVDALIEEQGLEAAIKWLMDAQYRRPKGKRTAAERGTAVHQACEEYALTGVKPEVDAEIQPYLDQFDKWCGAFQPEYVAAEMTVYSRTYGYAGTCDAFLKVAGMLAIVDYKTTDKSFDKKGNPTSPYPESVLQVNAYAGADFAAAWRVRRWENFRRRYYLLGEDERAMAVEIPKAETGLIIHIAPEHCNAHIVPVNESMFEAFLFHLEVARFALNTSKSVIGDPLVAA